MTEILGPMNLLDKALPTGIDGTRLAEWQLADGISYAELANQMALALGDINQQIVNEWGWLFYLTPEIFMEYEQGGTTSEMPELTDMDRPQPIYGDTLGHMIELRAYGQAIGGSRRYFRDVRTARIRAAISAIVRRGRWRFEKKLLGRFFSNTELAIGSAGYNVPFVRGTGGNVDYAPPAYDGEAFTTSHNHFIGCDSGSKTAADCMNEMAETLQEHGHTPTYTALISRADIATYYALENFVEIVEPVISTIDRGGTSAGPQFFATGTREFGMVGFYHSEYGLVELRASNRIPTGHAGMCKSYGRLDGRNPLAVRFHPDTGFGFYVVPETTPDDDTPVKQLDVEVEFGVGVGADRTNGTASYLVSGGTWAAPTIA